MNYSLADCRICLKNGGNLPIFGDEFKPDISLEIEIFGCIYLAKDDGFPQYICRDCFKLLEAAMLFKKYAKSSNAILKRWKRKTVHELPTISVVTSSPVKQNVQIEQNDPVSEATIETNYTAEFLLDSDEPRINFVSVRNDYQTVQYDVPLIEGIPEEQTETYIDETPVYKNEIHVFDNEVPVVENEMPVVDNHIPVGDNDASEVENENIVLIESDKSEVEEYYCKYCHLKFTLEEKYEEHRTTVEHKRNYVMSFFPKKKKNAILGIGNTEEKKMAYPKDLKCDICGKYFTKLYYPRHMEREHGIVSEKSKNSKRECKICHKMYHPVALVQHMKKIHGDKSSLPPKVKLECRVCKKLVSKEFYPLHIQRHTQGDTKNYVCEQCGKKFFFKSSFCTHRLTHSNDLPHKCEYCPYKGRTKELLKIHVRTHTGDYPYKCTECGTSCITKSNLNSHMKRHRGPVDFICDTCHRGFYSKIQLERHINVNHLGVKSHVCSICGAAFGYRHGLMGHQRKVHKRPKGLGKPKAVYLQLEEEGVTDPSFEV